MIPIQAVEEQAPQYEEALRSYLTQGDEGALHRAYTIGRDAIRDGLTSLVVLHGEALEHLMGQPDLEPTDRAQIINRSTQFLEEALAPFEMTVRGYQQANESLQQANLELRQADEMKDRFLAHMTHELRTPLGAIIGYCELLMTNAVGPLQDRQIRCLSTINTCASQLLKLVNDLLDLAKIRAGRLEVRAETILVNDVVEQCLGQIAPLAQAKGVAMARDLGGEVWATADADRVSQVVLNLLSNAVKFTPEGGMVSGRTSRSGGWAVLSVTDTGVGIGPDDQARVFEEFVQLEAGRDYGSNGTGLGLPLSQRLAHLMGGRIELQSRLGGGSVFSLLLPAAPAPGRRPARALPVGRRPSRHSRSESTVKGPV